MNLDRYVTHAVKFGDECVLETAREEITAYARELRHRLIPPPRDLTWTAPAERDRVLRERAEARETLQVELVALKRELDRLPARIALAQAKTGKATSRPKRHRRTTAELREQVLALRERGLVPAAIANTLNLSDRRTRALLAALPNRENRGSKPFVQAANHASSVVPLLAGHGTAA